MCAAPDESWGCVKMTAAPTRTAVVHLQELRDGSWIGNAAWGGRTLTDGAQDAQLVLRRLVSRLAAMPEAGQPDTVKLIRVSQSGPREEGEHELGSLLE